MRPEPEETFPLIPYTAIAAHRSMNYSKAHQPSTPVSETRRRQPTTLALRGEMTRTSPIQAAAPPNFVDLGAFEFGSSIAVIKGDVDGSGEVNFLDISPFIEAVGIGGNVNDPAIGITLQGQASKLAHGTRRPTHSSRHAPDLAPGHRAIISAIGRNADNTIEARNDAGNFRMLLGIDVRKGG